jgi:hypothetical protein
MNKIHDPTSRLPRFIVHTKQRLLKKPVRCPPRHFLLTLLIATIATLSIATNLASWTFTSDDVAQQTIAHDLMQPGPHAILLENDTYVSKLPVYLVFNSVLRPGRTQLVLESLVFNITMVLLLFWWWRMSSFSKPTAWLPFLWFLAAGVFWMSQTINPNTRNVDIGIMLLYAAYAIKGARASLKTHSMKLPLAILGFGAIGGCLSYDDPYFLFFIVLPLLLALFIQFYVRKSFLLIMLLVTILIICLGVYFSIAEVLKHFGLLISNKNELSTIAATITHPKDIPRRALQVMNAYLSLLGASPAYMQPDSFEWLRISANGVIVLLGLSGLWIIVRKKSYEILRLYLPITFIAVFACLTITGIFITESARYLIVLLPTTALLVDITLQQLRRLRPLYYRIAAAAVVIAVTCNTVQALTHLHQSQSSQPQNQISYRLASVMQKNNVSAVYATYWLSNITYYLSDYHANVLPAICSKGALFQDPTLLDGVRFNNRYKNIGILVSPTFAIPNENSLVATKNKPVNPTCTLSAMYKQFGKPQKILAVSPSVELLVYQSIK